jgi:hypothetical protein
MTRPGDFQALFLICFLLIPIQIFSQGEQILIMNSTSDCKRWEDGPLTWEDFQGKPFYTLDVPSDLSFILGFESEKLRIQDTTLIHLKATAYFLKDESWVNPSAKSDINLLFNQVIFDIIELYRRRMHNEMNQLSSYYQAQSYLHIYNNKIHQEIQELRNMMELGNFSFAIKKKNDEIQKELVNILEDKFPNFRRSAFGMGMHAGFGAGLLTGSLGNHFQTSKNLLYGFDFGYRNLVLYLTASLNYNSVIENYEERNNWEKGTRTGIAIMESSFGYNIYDGNKFKVAPFAGIALIEISNREIKSDTANEFRMVDYYNAIAGLNLDFKLRKRFNFYPRGSAFREYVETDIRVRLFVLPAYYYPDLKGYSVNLTIGMNGFLNFIRMNN